MILTGPEIEKRVACGDIVIDPFDPKQLNPNSYNLRLGSRFAVYDLGTGGRALDSRADNPTNTFEAPSGGIVLWPKKLYLAHTVERTATQCYVPLLEGRSSLARLGVTVHQTGGFGDVGFDGQWVLELSCVHPVRLYPNMEICQVAFFAVSGEVAPYRGRYQGQSGPVACRLWQDRVDDKP